MFLAPLADRLGVLDAIQRLPELLPLLRSLIERARHPGRFAPVETGSPVAKNVEVFPAHELGNGIPDAT